MLYKEKFFYLCRIPLSAKGPEDVEIVTKAENNDDFPRVFKQYEELRSPAFNDEELYSIVRADDIIVLIRNTTPDAVKEQAWEEAEANLITNLQHKVMHEDDQEAAAILKEVHDIELEEA
ncbi:MAG: hypothetical protein ACQETE_05875 [Bacteroidota bacterium]